MKTRIIIISKSNATIKKLANCLDTSDFETTISSSQQQFIDEFAELKPSLVMLDTRVTQNNTCSFLEMIRNKTKRNPVPVLLVLNHMDDLHFTICQKYNLTDFITLPLKANELLFRIDHLFSLANSRKSLNVKNRQLKQTIKSQEQLLSIIAHDLRAPISTIKMINDSILEEKDKIRNAGIRKKVVMIGDTTQEAYNLLENLLRWSKSQNGKTKLLRENFDISSALKEVIALFRSSAQNKNITINNEIPSNVWVYADSDMVKTILRNLLSNALKFTYPGGKIKISHSEEKNGIKISVRDNGRGINENEQKQLLTRNSSVSHLGTKNEKGSGLGLALCRNFIKQNEGSYGLNSKEGEGSTFYFVIPKAK